jgi:glycosyltransferase involved in cell wall biosynthesis
VLLVPSASVPSGVVTYVVNQARALHGTECAVVGGAESSLAEALPTGVGLIPTSGDVLRMAGAIARHGRRFAFVQAHGPRALLAARLAAIPRARLGYVFHEIDGPHARAELRLARRALLAANGYETAAWARSRLGLDVDALPPMVDIEDAMATRKDARRQLGIEHDELVVGVVGRLSAVKYPHLAVEALAASGLDATLVFIGDGPERDSLLATAQRLEVRIYLPGSIGRASSLMPAFDAVISCSPRESFGLAAAEAAVAGVPVVAVDSPGLRMLSDGGRLMTLLPPSPEAIGRAVAEAVHTENIGSELRTYIVEAFGPEAHSARLRAHLARVSARGGRS